jgi:hypothetical protein
MSNPNRNALMSPRASPMESPPVEDSVSVETPSTPSPIVSPNPSSSSSESISMSPSPLSYPETPTHEPYPEKSPSPVSFPETPTHIVSKINIDDDATHALEHFGETPPDFENEKAHNDYYKRFVEFHRNPTMSRNRRPFATGRRRSRSRKCKPCKRRRTCKNIIKRRKTYKKRHYKRKNHSHKRHRHRHRY